MKRLILLCLMLYGIAHAQTTGYFRYDTVRFEKVGANSEFVLLNATRGIAGGVLTNIGNGRTAFVLPGTIKTLYTADDSIQGNRTVYIRGGSPNTNSRQLTFNFNTRRPGHPTETSQYDVQFNQNFGSGPITYFWNYDDSSVNQMGWVNDGGGVNRGNEAGFLLHGSDRQWFANGFQGGFVLRSNRLPVTVSMEGPYPFQVYMKAPSYPANLTAKPSFWLDSNSKAYLPYLTRLTSTTWLAAYDSTNGEVKYIRTDAISGGGSSSPSLIEVNSSQTLAEPSGVYDIIEVDASAAQVDLTLDDIPVGKGYIIKKIDNLGFAVTFTTSEGVQTLTKQGDVIMIYSAGSGTYRTSADYTLPTVISVSSSSTLPTPANSGTTVKTDCTSGAVTHTLPLASANPGRIFRLKKMDATANAMNVTILEGALSVTTQYAGWVIQSDGTNWFILGTF